ncbi:uncharacterized protein [Diadema antillarum]|uniref:uncharacterized protein n=1 Tax=Diadema antillarum TaxID=105358 RepID=UPI003A85979F
MATFDNKDAVLKKYNQLESVFQLYEGRFREYHSKLVGADAEAALEKFEQSKQNIEEFRGRLKDWKEAGERRGAESVRHDDNASVRSVTTTSSRSSRRSSTSSSSSRLREAKVKRELAKLKKVQFERSQRVKLEQLKLGQELARMEIEDELTNAEVEEKLWEEEVLNRLQVKPNDEARLWDLARDMRRCQMVLSQMGYSADMNSSDNLLKIQDLLPMHLQSEWAKQAHRMMNNRVCPSFESMTEFIEQSAKLASNMFGQNIKKSSKPAVGSGPKKGPQRMTFTTQASMRSETSTAYPQGVKCPCCSQQHGLKKCQKFKERPFSDRIKLTRQLRLCDNCLQPSHSAVGCSAKPQCEKAGCNRKHHTLLHPPQSGKKEERRNDSSAPTSSTGTSMATATSDPTTSKTEGGQCLSTSSSRKRVCLRVVPVNVTGNGQVIQTWALLDEGSDVSLCSDRLVKRLGIQGAPKDFQLNTVGNSLSNQKGLEVGLTVSNITDGKTINLPKVWTVKEMNISHTCIPTKADLAGWPHLKGITLPYIDEEEVQLLIGGDTPEAFWVLDQRRGNPKEPYAVRTPLGWSLLGPTSSKSRSSSAIVNFVRQEEDPLHNQLKQFWELDFGGYLQEEKTGMSIEDQRALKMMENTARKVGNHYEVGLPWRYWPPEIPSNRYLAEVRLKYLKRKLEKDEALHERYTTTIGEYISNGYAEEVKDESDHQSKSSDGGENKSNEPKELKWYLPHHAVVHPHKPEKVRVVFDCAARYRGTALNDQLLQGPDLTNNLAGVLIRFRQERVAFVADVQGMFHQVKVPVKDRDAMRFPWWRDGDLSKEPTEYRMTVHLFGATSSPSCAGFALRKTAEDALGQFNKEVIDTVLNNFYVDDCLKSVKCRDDAMSLVENLRCLLAQGGFRLTKCFNSRVGKGRVRAESRS